MDFTFLVLHELKTLTSVQIQYSKLTTFPRIASKTVKLLGFEGNQFHTIADNVLDNLPSIQSIKIGWNYLTEIPPG